MIVDLVPLLFPYQAIFVRQLDSRGVFFSDVRIENVEQGVSDGELIQLISRHRILRSIFRR